MKHSWFFPVIILTLLYASCGGGKDDSASETPLAEKDTPSLPGDEARGTGKFTHVDLTYPLDQNMVATGQKIYDVKCASCHKLTDEKIVGPGWKDVTKRRTPEWLMNFITNTEEMLNKDPESIAMLEICLVRMPDQNLSDDEARAVLEHMRANDGEK